MSNKLISYLNPRRYDSQEAATVGWDVRGFNVDKAPAVFTLILGTDEADIANVAR